MIHVLTLLACAAREGSAPPTAPAAAPPAAPTTEDTCTFLTINDTYRIEPLADGTGGMARVRTLRKSLEARYGTVVLLHAGDFLAPSLMSRTYAGAQMVEVLDALDGDPAAMDDRMYVVFGNHEFDASSLEDAPVLDRLVTDSQFRWFGTNIVFGGTEAGPYVNATNLVAFDRFTCAGIEVGIFGITTDRKSAKFISSFAPAIATAETQTAALRAAGAELVVALTHQSKEEDVAMLDALGAKGPDIVVGGHEHDHVRAESGGRPVYKADADARTAWRVTLRKKDGVLQREDELVTLDGAIAEDPAVKAIVDARIVAHDEAFCTKAALPAGCLAAEIGSAGVPLVAAELEIRRFETNFGGWIVDRAREAFPDAQIAFVNSGSLRLNRDLAAGPLRRQDVEEMFAYPTPLVRIVIDGDTLEKVVARAVEEWSGNGHWLQVSGFAWAHDPVANTATRLTLLSTGKPIGKKDKLVAVVPAYLVDATTKRDGYTMLPTVEDLAGPDLKELVFKALAASPGITPKVEGRICNPQRAGACLAVP